MTSAAGSRGSADTPAWLWLCACIPLLLVIAVYARTAEFQFVFDDTSFILTNPFVHSPANIPRYFTEPVWSGIAISQKNYYRPVFLLWVLGNYTAFGPHPAAWHVTSLLLHVVNVLLVYLVALRLTRVPLAASIAAALFGLHPLQVEAVAWICCANDLLACLFAVASFLAYLRAREARGETRGRRAAWWSVSVVAYAAAALSKEPAVALPFVLLLHEWFGGPAFRPDSSARANSPRASLPLLVPYVGVALCYFLLRRHALGGILGTSVPLISLRTELLTIPSLLLTYLGHFLWPVNLSPFYDVPYQQSFTLTGVFLPALLVLLPGGLCAWAAWRSAGARIALAWALLFLAPALHIAAFPRGELVHDRFLYLPMAGISAFTAVGFRAAQRFLGRAQEARFHGVSALAWATGTMLVALGLIAWRQTGFWSTNFDLFQRGVEIAPQNGIAAGNLGIEYMRVGDRSTAALLLRRADALNPDLWEADNQQGVEHFQRGKFREAEQAFDVAVATRPDASFPHLMLGLVYLRTGRAQQAVAEARRAVALAPHEPGFHFGLATVLEETGDLAAAREEYRAELAIRPDHQPSRQKLREVDQRLGASPVAGHP